MEILLIALESKLHSKLMITGDTLLKDIKDIVYYQDFN